MDYRFIDPEKIKNMLFNDGEYITEFCEAGVSSLEEFTQNYRTHLLNKDMVSLRKAGHKVRPGVQMMGADKVVEKYEQGKRLIEDKADKETLNISANEMKTLCLSVQQELTQLAENQK